MRPNKWTGDSPGRSLWGMTYVLIASLIPLVLSHFQSVVCPISAANSSHKIYGGSKALAVSGGGFVLP